MFNLAYMYEHGLGIAKVINLFGSSLAMAAVWEGKPKNVLNFIDVINVEEERKR
jgi:hypothetical protein